MKPFLVPLSLLALLFAGGAHAELSRLNAMCPGDLEIHVDEGGPVFVNGRESRLKRFNDNYFEATDAKSGVVISISRNPDGSSIVTYTGKNRANGVCTVAGVGDAEKKMAAASTARETYPAAEKACLAAVAGKTNVSVIRLSVIETLSAEAGIVVKVQVPGADAPWACMTDKRGRLSSVSYTGSEGAL